FVTNVWQLIILRFLLGTAIGGIVPTRIAYIRNTAPVSMQGEVLGYNTSLRFLGNILGPALVGLLAGWFGISSVFIVSSVLLLFTVILLLYTNKRENFNQYRLAKNK